MISVDLFMEVNGTLVWLVDDDEIDKADRVKRSFRNDIYPEGPPIFNKEEMEKLKAAHYDCKFGRGRFDWIFRFPYIKKGDFELYEISRRRSMVK